MKHFLVYTLLSLTFFGCETQETSCGQAYFGGEIINPNNDFLVLYDNVAPIDTLYLDEKDRFLHKIENLKSGLHSFTHGGEYQVLLLEPNDSLLLRLNTLDFDESIVFTGRGSKKNNYLINLFLKLESEDKMIYKLSKLDPKGFLDKIDSLKSEKYDKLNRFIEKYPSSELFKKVTKVGIDYNYYTLKESYPLRHFGINKSIHLDSLPEGYYDFRKNIDYNDDELTEFAPYYILLFNNLNNLASEKYFAETGKDILVRTNIDYNLYKLELMDSLINSSEIKNVLLKSSTQNFLSRSTSFKDSEAVYNSFLAKNTDDQNAVYITNLYSTLKRLEPGNTLPNVDILNYYNEITSINKISNKPTVFYFWSNINRYNVKNSHKKLKDLREIYPNIDFVSINVNSNNTSVWKRILKQNHIDVSKEYRFRNPQVAKKLLAIQYINKVIIINNDKTIAVSNANIFSYDFKDLLNQLK